MRKEPEYHIGCGLFCKIYAGTLTPPDKNGMQKWRHKSEVTEEAIFAVMQLFKTEMQMLRKTTGSSSYKFPNGMTLTVNFKLEKEPPQKGGAEDGEESRTERVPQQE